MRPTDVEPTGSDPTPTEEQPTTESPRTPPSGTRPLSARPPEPPAWPPPTPPAPPEPTATPERSSPSPRRAALLGAVAGGLAAAVVATGITVAVDDDTSGTAVDRPVVTPVTTETGALDIQGILARVQRSVVAIETSATTSSGAFEGAGSGIILSSDGLVLTNAHVIGSIGDITVVLPDGTRHQATLVGASPDDDLAVVQVQDVDDLVAADLGSSDDLQVGDEVIAIGNALNLGGDPTVTRGIVSAKDRDLTAEGITLSGLIQTDAAINPGNSGGPLVNVEGEVVGMNTAIVADAQNLGFAIAIDTARPVIRDLQAGEGQVTPGQAFLGVSSTDVADLTPDVRARFDITVDEGAFVAEVVPGSAADEAGLQAGDVIVAIDGDEITESSDVRDAILDHDPGDRIELDIIRGGDERTVRATLEARGDRS
jgi:putative serine protease PepD